MKLTIPAACEWLVARGFHKVDTIENHPNHFAHRVPDTPYWLATCVPGLGEQLLNINLAADQLSPRIGLTLFTPEGSTVVENISIGGPQVGTVGTMDATGLTLADLPRLLELLPTLAAAVTTAQAEGRPLSDDDLIARSDQCSLLSLVEVG
jgi:hypothetical protein